MPNSVRVAAVQMTCRLGDVEANLTQAEAEIAQVSGSADIVCLPELFTTAYHLEALGSRLFELAEPIPVASGDPVGPSVQRLCELAARYNVAIIAGVAERDPRAVGLIYDSAVLIDRQGQLCGRYRKSHLYPAEHGFFRPGATLPIFELDGVRVGIAICFEAAFPPIFTTLALSGAHIIFNPSAVPVGYAHLQDVRTRARAQDNQLFVVAVNHVGLEGDISYCGTSQIADPCGNLLAVASSTRPQVILAELDLALIVEQRLQEPVLRGLRPELYRFSNP